MTNWTKFNSELRRQIETMNQIQHLHNAFNNFYKTMVKRDVETTDSAEGAYPGVNGMSGEAGQSDVSDETSNIKDEQLEKSEDEAVMNESDEFVRGKEVLIEEFVKAKEESEGMSDPLTGRGGGEPEDLSAKNLVIVVSDEKQKESRKEVPKYDDKFVNGEESEDLLAKEDKRNKNNGIKNVYKHYTYFLTHYKCYFKDWFKLNKHK